MREKCNVLSIIILGIILSLFIMCSSVSMPKFPPRPLRPTLEEGEDLETVKRNNKKLIIYIAELEARNDAIERIKQ